MRWKRFRRCVDSYWYLSTTSVDALKFIPKRDIKFFGFGMFSNYNGKDMTMKVSWFLEDEDPGESREWYEVTVNIDECELAYEGSPGKVFDFYIQSVGQKPFIVREGQKLTVMAKSTHSDSTLARQYYGSDGYDVG